MKDLLPLLAVEGQLKWTGQRTTAVARVTPSRSKNSRQRGSPNMRNAFDNTAQVTVG
eukprot:CAMPEP_0179117758 /NCGR_PEP_ID=MMETSP0796-20121207/55330_1 /TAXON_ID=73915 /ORGANISM="Pyrodinium bahamense, Strain pbaha01" /LENGTH=56 /DNA_ID=CAMNT_0020816149 /DNA_START=44 /DNA_END=214 /DNA_ORIENTATION=-